MMRLRREQKNEIPAVRSINLFCCTEYSKASEEVGGESRGGALYVGVKDGMITTTPLRWSLPSMALPSLWRYGGPRFLVPWVGMSGWMMFRPRPTIFHFHFPTSMVCVDEILHGCECAVGCPVLPPYYCVTILQPQQCEIGIGMQRAS